MSSIEEVQTRLSAAIERISAGADDLPSRAQLAALTAALEAERQAHDATATQLSELRAEVDTLRAGQAAAAQTAQTVQSLDVDLQRLRASNAQLRASNAALREANAEGLADAELVNTGLVAELEALRAERAADRAEADTILSALAALTENTQGAQIDA